MTLEKLYITLASGAAVLVLIFIAWALGFRTRARIANEQAARDAIGAQEIGATVEQVLVGKDGRAALARLADGRLATIRAMGDGLAIRAFPAASARIARTRLGLRVTFPDIGHPRVDIRFDGDPPGWALA